MADTSLGETIGPAIVLMGAAVAAVPLFRRLGLYSAAAAGGVIDARDNALFTTVVISSMALAPLRMIAADRLLRNEASMEGVELARDLKGTVLIFGFGRFCQIASQLLLARSVSLSVIDTNPDRIRDAGRFGFKVTARVSIPCAIPGPALPCVDDLRQRSEGGAAHGGTGAS